MTALRQRIFGLLSSCMLGLGWGDALAAINWSNDVTLTEDTTVTSTSGTFSIGNSESADDVFLETYELKFEGTGNFRVRSQLQGAGNVFINLDDDTRTVRFDNDDNNYTGSTRVKSGILDLRTPANGNNLHDLRIGGGNKSAVVTRASTANNELISDSATVTLKENGTLEFVRQATGSNAANASTETFNHLKMEGGTLLNNSANTALATSVLIDKLTLEETSFIDLGAKMSLTFGNVDNRVWTAGKTLYISDWDSDDSVVFGDITESQLAQIMFDMGTGFVTAVQLGSGEIVPSTTVPEAGAVAALPILGGLIVLREYRKRRAANVRP